MFGGTTKALAGNALCPFRGLTQCFILNSIYLIPCKGNILPACKTTRWVRVGKLGQRRLVQAA